MEQSQDSKRQRISMTSSIAPSFGRWLIVAIVALNLLVVATGMFSLKNSRADAEHLAQVQTQNMALAIEQSIGNSIDKISQSLRAVAYEMERQLALKNADLPAIEGEINQQKRLLPEAIGFRVIDANGQALLGHTSTQNPKANVADREYFMTLRHSPNIATLVSKPLTSRHTGDRVIAFANRISRPDGSFAGAVSIAVSVEHFRSLLSGFDMGTEGALVLRDADLGLITRHPETFHGKAIEHGTDKLTSTFKAMTGRGLVSGTYQGANQMDHVDRIYSFRKLSNAPMYVIAGLSETDYLARWRRELWGTLLFISAFILTTGIGGSLLLKTWKRQIANTEALRENHNHLSAALTKLDERDRALTAAQKAGGLGIYTLDFATGIFSSSAELDGIFGAETRYLRNLEGWFGLVHPEDSARIRDWFSREVVSGVQTINAEYRIVRPSDGSTRWVHVFGTLDFDEAGKPLRMSGAILDITERKRFEEQLRLAHEVFVSAREAVIVTDEHGNIVDVNPAFTDVAGYGREEVIGKSTRLLGSGMQDASFYRQLWSALTSAGYWEGELQNRRKDGSIYLQATKISAVRDEHGKIVLYIALASDVTQLRASQRQIEHLAYHDKLTNLPNRVMLAERLKQAIEQADQSGELLGICYLDLDGFKEINDIWGHDTGDEVLVEIAQRLKASIRHEDTVARLGGDEFVVLLRSTHGIIEIEQAIRRMLATIGNPVKAAGKEAQLTASIGVAIYPDDVEDADLLVRRADQAMYTAKRKGKNQYFIFDSEAERQLKEQQILLQQVTAAISGNQFTLHYQPKVDMFSGKIIGMEALIRWQHPERGLVPPLEFLPAIKNTELCVGLGEWVITQALRQMADWKAIGLDLPVSVNIDGYHLQQPDFIWRLSGMLSSFPGIAPAWLQLEILETSAMENIDAVSSIITRCLELGVTFALDDFGTGYSSLTYFRHLPTQLMKIDRSFVQDMLNDPEDFALVEAIVKLANSLQREVIAEGVESVEHGLALMQIGCHLAQGYGIARPMPPESVPQWVGNWVAPPAWQELAISMRKPDTPHH